MDPGLEVQVLCGASWKQPQAEGNCTQVGASHRVSVPRNATPKIQPRSERYWGRERQYIQCPYPGRSAWGSAKGTPSRVSDGVRAVGRKEATTTGRRPCRSRISS